jgi:hypothetical protein
MAAVANVGGAQNTLGCLVLSTIKMSSEFDSELKDLETKFTKWTSTDEPLAELTTLRQTLTKLFSPTEETG